MSSSPSHTNFNNRSRSIDLRTKRNNSNPFSVGGIAAARMTRIGKVSHDQVNDVVKRFKNISDREAPANHISDKVYATAQN